MSAISRFTLKVKRKDGPFFAFLHAVARGIVRFNLPSIRWIHLPLYHADRAARSLVGYVYQALWAVPLFKARCAKAGRNLRLPNGIPHVVGDHLRIFLGDDVTIMRTTIGASKVFDAPVLRIGNRSAVGYGTVISVSREVVIGDHCLIGANCLIMDSDDHPVQPARRRAGECVAPGEVQPVRIGDNVWLGSYVTVLKGVTVADNSVIAAHSVVTKDVVGNTVYAGFPARPVVRDIDKLEGVAGRDP